MCILIDTKNKALICSKTQEAVYPVCFDDLMAYHSYLMSRNHPKQAYHALKDVFKGEKVITNMINSASGGLKK